ncbi:MAG: hypothetical protein ACYS3S_05240 [Planctomycetota bacterium]
MKRRKVVFVDFMTLFNLFFVFSYLIPAIVFLLNPLNFHKWRFLAIVPETMESFSVMLAITVGYFSIVVGYLAGSKQRIRAYPQIVFKYGEKTQFVLIVFFFAVLSAAFMVYVYGYGGVVELLLSGKDIRAGRKEAGVYQYFGYFASGLPLSMLLFYSFKKYSGKVFYSKISKYFFVLAFLLSLIYTVGEAGRGKIGMIFLVLLFFWLNYGRPKFTAKKIVILLFFSVSVFCLVKYGKQAIWSIGALRDGPSAYISAFEIRCKKTVPESRTLGESLIGFARNFDHGISSVYLSLFQPDIYQSPRLFFDWLRAFPDAFPGISQPEFVVSGTPSSLNRDHFKTGGYVPPGWVAMKIINGSIIWLLAGSLIAGFIGGYLNKLLLLSWDSSPIMPALFIYMAFFWKDYIVGPDPFMVVLKSLATYFLFFLLAGILIIKIRRMPNESYFN